MRIAVDHQTHYRFTDPQARIVEMLRLTPSDTRDQTVVSWRIDVNIDARLRDARDGFGNAITMLYAEGPIDALDISVTGEVLTVDSSGVISASTEPLPPMLFLRATKRTAPSAELSLLTADAGAGCTSVLDRLHRLNLALHERFENILPGPDRGFSAGAALALESVAPRDLAHMFICGAHSLGLPARYVSGYRAHAEGPSCSPHAWAEAHVERLGWVAFDPSMGISADAHYVRVAVGLDSASAAPVVGHRIGGGGEKLAVDLHVDRVGGEE